MRGITLLSEINPRGVHVAQIHDPIYQGERWFKLLTPTQADDLRYQNVSFSDVIDTLCDEAAARGNQLVLRDWSQVDFFERPLLSPPHDLSIDKALRLNFDINSICVVRHPVSQWMSLNRHDPRNPVSITEFLTAYLEFAERAFEIGFVRYEDFCKKPDTVLQSMCNALAIEFDETYKDSWQGYMPISGDDVHYDPDGVIRPEDSVNFPRNVVRHFLAREEYFHAASLFGYATLGERVFDERLQKREPTPYWLAEAGNESQDNGVGVTLPSEPTKAAQLSRRPDLSYDRKSKITIAALKSMPKSNGRVFLVDPSIRDELGHHYYLSSALKQEVEAANKECVVLGFHQMSEKIGDLNGFAYFEVTGFGSKPNGSEFENYQFSVGESQNLTKSLAELPKSVFRKNDFVFFPTVSSNMILAIIGWMLSFEEQNRPSFGICLMFQPDWHFILRYSKMNYQLYAAAFSLLKDTPLVNSVVFTTETQGLAERYQREFGIAATAMPIPTIGQDLRASIERQPRSAEAVSTPVISCIGYARQEKGTHFMPEIYDLLSSAGYDFVLKVQIVSHDEVYLANLENELKGLEKVQLIYDQLTMPEVAELIAETDIMLLPYDRRTYANRGSTLFNEARLLGVPVILPSGTDIGAEAAEQGCGVLFDEWTAGNIAQAIAKAIDELSVLKENADRVRQSYFKKGGYLANVFPYFGC